MEVNDFFNPKGEREDTVLDEGIVINRDVGKLASDLSKLLPRIAFGNGKNPEWYHRKTDMKGRIVLADDDHDSQVVLRKILTNAGYEVISLVGGTDIVNNRCCVPDLFLVHIQMTIIDGLALCKYLKINKCTRKIPVVLMSECHEFRKRAEAAGADHFLAKPLIVDEFLKVIDNLIMRSDHVTQA